MCRRIPSKLSFNSSYLPRLDTGLKIRTKSAHKKCPQHLCTEARSSRRGDDTMGVGARPRRSRRCSNLVRSESRWYVTHALLWQKRAICLHLIGVCIGVNAAIISIVSEWFSDIKMGYCSDGWWLNQQFCCWEMEGDEVDGCETWHTWSTVTLARWIIFIMFAVSFFCRLCSLSGIHFPRLYPGYLCFHCFASCALSCEICRWFWYIRN